MGSGVDAGLAAHGEGSCLKPVPATYQLPTEPISHAYSWGSMICGPNPHRIVRGTNEITHGKTLCNHTALHKLQLFLLEMFNVNMDYLIIFFKL